MTPETAAGLISLLSLLKDLGAYGVLGAGVWLLLTNRVVTRKHMDEVVAAVTASRDVQTSEAKAREEEWKRLAIRGIDIAVPLATAVKELGTGVVQGGGS